MHEAVAYVDEAAPPPGSTLPADEGSVADRIPAATT